MSHYFDEPSVASARRDVELTLPDVTLQLATDRGVFGYGQVDVGTKVLLRRVPPPPVSGTLVDLGCGTGAIALTMATRAPLATVWAIDVNPRARALCEHNAQRNGLRNVRVADPASALSEIDSIDALWSNPPIRIGKSALHELLDTWLARLAASGEAWLVVHQHLGADSLTRWMNERGVRTERVDSVKGYRVLRSTRRVDLDP